MRYPRRAAAMTGPCRTALLLLLMTELHGARLPGQLSVKETTWRAATVLAFSTDSLTMTNATTTQVVARYRFGERADTLLFDDVPGAGRCGAGPVSIWPGTTTPVSG